MPRKQPTEPRKEVRLLDDLIEHPLQKFYNDGLSDQAFKAFAADIKKNGLRQKIQVLPGNRAGLPPNTMLDGHKRRRALLYNGETETTVIVRYDLTEADELTVEKEFLEFNAHREHRDTLLQARTALRLFEIEKKRPRGELKSWDEAEARDRVGKAINMSGRNLSRYFRVLKTPVEVQNAFRAEQLALVVAEKVADLDTRTQQQVAERVRDLDLAGMKKKDQAALVKRTVEDFLPNPAAKKEPSVGEVLGDYVAGLSEGRQGLEGKLNEIRRGRYEGMLEELRLSKQFLPRVIGRLESLTRESVEYFKQLDEEDEKARRQIRGEDECDARLVVEAAACDSTLPDEAFVP
jgi:ParB-like chromosome segregation protein Spo0J